jgi:hypothetical protein
MHPRDGSIEKKGQANPTKEIERKGNPTRS